MHRRAFLAAPAIVAVSASLMLPWRARGQPVTHSTRWAERRLPAETIVKFKPGITPDTSAIAAILTRHGARINARLPTGVCQIVTREADAKAMAEELEESGLVEYAEPNTLLRVHATPNDTYYSSQNYLTYINAPNVWPSLELCPSTCGAMPPCVDVNIGVCVAHPDLAANLLTGHSVPNGNTNVDDSNNTGSDAGHGSQCAGLMCAVTNNATGIASASWGGTLIPVQVSTDSNSLDSFNISTGLDWIVNNVTPPGVVNMSFGGAQLGSDAYQTYFPTLYKSGFFLVCSAGDSNGGTCTAGPSQSDFVLAVTATQGIPGTPFAKATVYPSWGPAPTLGGNPAGAGALVAAPGGSGSTGIYMTDWKNGYTTGVIGTSFSSPIIAAMARYLMVANPALTVSDIWYILTNPANGQATTGFTGVSAPWLNPPQPLMDLCYNAAVAGTRSPYSGRRRR